MKYDIGHLIRSKEQFDSLWRKFQTLLADLRQEKDQSKLLFFDDAIVTRFKWLSNLMYSVNEDFMVFTDYTKELLQYYSDNLKGVYPIMIVKIEDGQNQYKKQLDENPCRELDIKMDASLFRIGRSKFALFPLSGKWFMYTNDYQEVAVLHASSELIALVKDKFFTEFPGDLREPNDFYMHDE